jgi:hypothetical protein
MTIVTTTAAAACTTHHTIVCVGPRRSFWLRGSVGGCSYHPSPPKKLRVTTNATQKRPSAIFDDPNIDWFSVQKDIVIL